MREKFSDERRTFLKMAVVVGGVTAGLSLAKRSAAKQEQPLEQEKTGQGYRETEHISKYYKTARI
jgi:hypothetical protein